LKKDCSMQLRRCVGGDVSYFEGCDFDFLSYSYRSNLFLSYDTPYLCMDFHQIWNQRATRVKSSPRNMFARAQRVFFFYITSITVKMAGNETSGKPFRLSFYPRLEHSECYPITTAGVY